MALEFTTSQLRDSLAVLRYYKHLAEGALAQVPDEALTDSSGGEDQNSIATAV